MESARPRSLAGDAVPHKNLLLIFMGRLLVRNYLFKTLQLGLEWSRSIFRSVGLPHYRNSVRFNSQAQLQFSVLCPPHSADFSAIFRICVLRILAHPFAPSLDSS